MSVLDDVELYPNFAFKPDDDPEAWLEEKHFRNFIERLGGEVGRITFDSDGVVEIVIHWPNGWQILSPRTAHKGQ